MDKETIPGLLSLALAIAVSMDCGRTGLDGPDFPLWCVVNP
jgi:hypothetical protein